MRDCFDGEGDDAARSPDEERIALMRALSWAADQAAALNDGDAEQHIRRAIAVLSARLGP